MREVGRGSGMEERSLEIGEVLRGGGRKQRWALANLLQYRPNSIIFTT